MKHLKNIVVCCLYMSAVISVKAQDSIDVTYIANEGFLIRGITERILIDGIFNSGYGIYHVPAAAVISAERNAISPFDSVTVSLITHKDSDHCKASYVVDFMINNTGANLLAPPQVQTQLQSIANYATISGRLVNVMPTAGMTIDTVVHEIDFKIIPIQHAADPSSATQNTAYEFSVNGMKIFHAGDANSVNISEFNTLHLTDDSIDIAFLPCWFFDPDSGNVGKEIIRSIKPKTVVLMHLEISKYTAYQDNIDTIEGLPPMYIVDGQMKTLRFIRDEDSIIVEQLNTSVISCKNNSEVRVLPVSNDGLLTVYIINSTAQRISAEIYSLDGRMINETSGQFSGAPLQINLKEKPEGIYVLRLKLDNMYYNKKVYVR